MRAAALRVAARSATRAPLARAALRAQRGAGRAALTPSMRGVWTLTTAPDRDRQPHKRSITVGPEVAQALTVVPPVLLQGVFVSPLPAVRGYANAGTTGDASVAPYALMVANGTVWLTYGILIEAPTVALPNVTAVALGMYYTYTFHTYKPADAPFGPYVAGATAVASLAVGTALVLEPEAAAHTVGLIGCGVLPAMFAGPLAAARKVVSSKNAAAIPLAFTLFSTVNTITWIGYGLLVIDDVYIWGPNVVGLGASFAQLALVARYGRK